MANGIGLGFELKDPLGLYSGTTGIGRTAQLVEPTGDRRLPAGMRNNNPGNIKFSAQNDWVGQRGPSVNTDQGDPQVVFDSPESGMRAAYKLARNKYNAGARTANQIIAGDGGWTPGNTQAAANVARTMGLSPDDDLNLEDPAKARQFLRALTLQEHGQAALAYGDDMIGGVVEKTRGEAADPFTIVDRRGKGGDPEGEGMARLASPPPKASGRPGVLQFAHQGQEAIDPDFRSMLEDVSSEIGKPLVITSGYRSPSHPVEAAKETGPGEHSRRTASDISMEGMDDAERANLVLRLHARGVRRFGTYDKFPNMLHVDLKDQQGDGTPWFMHNTTNSQMSRAPAWFRELSNVDMTATAGAGRGKPLSWDNFQIADPMGLYAGRDPLADVRPNGRPQGQGNPGEVRRGTDGQTYQYAETTGMDGATGPWGWIRVNEATLRPFQIGESIANADGSVSTEITTTWQLPDGKWVNVPSLWMGPDGPVRYEPGDERGILGTMEQFERQNGQTFERFETVQEAEAAARARSAAGGAGAAGGGAGGPDVDAAAAQMNAVEPGRYKAMTEAEYAEWQKQFEASQPGVAQDLARMGAGGAVKGTGQVLRGVGAIGKVVFGPSVETVNAIFGTNYKPSNVLAVPADWLDKYGIGVQEGVSQATKEAIEGSSPDGDLLSPSTWTLGKAPSVRGYTALALDVFGSMTPVIAAAITTGGTGAVVVGGAQGGGAADQQAQDAIEAMAAQPGVLEKESAYFREQIAAGKSREEAVQATKEAAGQTATLFTAPVSALGGGITSKIINPATAIAAGARLPGRIAARTAAGAVEEGSQEAAETVATRGGANVGAGMDQSLTEGTFGDFLLGAIGGGATGAPAGALSRREAPPVAAETPPVAQEAAPVAPVPAPGPQPKKGVLQRAVDYGQNKALTTAAESGATPVQVGTMPTSPNTPAIGATVRVDAPGMPPFMGRVDSIEGDEVVIVDSAGEVLQVPASIATPIAPPVGGPITKETRKRLHDLGYEPEAVQAMSGDQAGEILRAATPEPGDVAAPLAGSESAAAAPPVVEKSKSELPPRSEQIPASEAFPGPPRAGQRVIVDAPEAGERFAGVVESWDGSEAIVKDDAGRAMQVPLDKLYVSRLTPKQVEAQDLEREPPVEREPPEPSPRLIAFKDKAVELPDDIHAALYALGKARFQAKRLGGTSQLDLDATSPPEQRRIASEFGITPAQAGQAADDYRYRVERAGATARSKLPVKMHKLDAGRLAQWRVEAKKEAAIGQAGTPEFDEAEWWDGELSDRSRAEILRTAGIRRSEKTRWGGFSPNIRAKLRGFRPDLDVDAEAIAAAVMADQEGDFDGEGSTPTVADYAYRAAPDFDDKGGLDVAANEAATSPTNNLPQPTEAQKEAGNYKLGHHRIGGMDISIENPAGSTREGTSRSGKAWKVEMRSHYGYIRGTKGKDKDHIDVFVKPGTAELADEAPVFVVDQRDPARGVFDEHKVMMGFTSKEEAEAAYRANYSPNWKGLGAITEIPLGDFKVWLDMGDTTKPFAGWMQPKGVAVAEDADDDFDALPVARGSEDEVLNRMATRHSVKEFIAMLADKPRKQVAAVIDQKGRIWEITGTSTLDINPNAGAHSELWTELGHAGVFPKPDYSNRDEPGISGRYIQITRYGDQMGLGATSPHVITNRQKATLRALDGAANRNAIAIVVDKGVEGLLPSKESAAAPGTSARQKLSPPPKAQPANADLQPQTAKSAARERTIPRDLSPEAQLGSIEDFGIDALDLDKQPGDRAADEVLKRGRASGRESLIGIDEHGDMIANVAGNKTNTGMPKMLWSAMGDPEERVVVHHNHPSSSSFSRADIAMAMLPGAHAIYAHGHDGSVFRVEVPKETKGRLQARISSMGGKPELGPAKYLTAADQILKPLYRVLDKTFEDAIRGGELSVDAANKDFAHLWASALHDAGLMVYNSNRPRSALTDIPSIADAYDRIVTGYGRIVATARPDRPASAVRARGDLEHVPSRFGSPAPERPAPAVDRGGEGEAGASRDARTPGEEPAEVAPAPEPFAKNKLFTADKVAAARARLKSKMGQINSGIDPEMLVDGMTIAGAYVEAGVRDFADYARRMTEDFGPEIQPYLLSFWEATRNYPGLDTTGMTSVVDSARLHVEQRAPVTGPARDDTIRSSEQGAPDAEDSETDQGAGGGDADGPEPQRDAAAARANPEDLATGTPGDVGGTPEGGGRGRRGVSRPAGDVGSAGGTARRGDERDRRPRARRAGTPAADAGDLFADRAGAGAGTPDVVVVKEPETVSPANAGPGDFYISDPLKVAGGGAVARFNRNKAAIELRNTLIDEGRQPTVAEQELLAGYTGWGSFGQELFQGTWAKPKPKGGWEARDRWLRENLGQAEWEGLQRSIINAHYTDPPTVRAMWDMVRRMGFKGGRVLEPSIGIGNFYGMMPPDMTSRSVRSGIELDPVTGSMAQMLYPDSNVRIMGYEASTTPDNIYDLVIGNWPFADVVMADRRYNRLSPLLHDYFFLKALDQVRPGGIVIGLTSKGTMDKKASTIRAELAKKAELVTAFRLPTGAFEEYAGTKVVTDIIVLRKRPEPIGVVANEGWIAAPDFTTPEGEKLPVNEFYHAHPENVLGIMRFGQGTTIGRTGLVVDRPADMQGALDNAVTLVPEGAYRANEKPRNISYIANHTDDRTGALVDKDGTFYVVQGDQLAKADQVRKYALKSPAETAKREAQLRDLIAMRKLYGTLIDAERHGQDTEAARKALREAFTAYRKDHGNYSKSFGLDYLRKIDDPFYPALAALEATEPNDKGGKSYRPAEIMTRSTMRGKPPVQNPGVRDAFVIARNSSVNPTIGDIAAIAGKPEADVRAELIESGAGYNTPAGDFVPADIYLSGNVRQKLREAKAAFDAGNINMSRNVEALKEVVPEDIPYYKIETQMGATWVPASTYEEFVAFMLGLDSTKGIKVGFQAGAWHIDFPADYNHRSEAQSGYGSQNVKFKRLVRATIANQTVVVKYPKDADGKEEVNEEATKEVNGKIAAMRQKFGEWLWSDPQRRVDLEQEYNEVRNAWATPVYDGSFLAFEGMALQLGNRQFNLRQHQVNAIWRGLVTRKSLNAHEVGTGKTFTMGGIAVESRRYGIAKKPLLFAHNANSATVAHEIQQMYPGARILYLDNLSAEDVKTRMMQIANDDWDLVVVPHSLIDRFGFKEETLMAMAQQDIADLDRAAEEAAEEDGATITEAMFDDPEELKKLRSPTAKQLVKQRQRIIETIKKLAQKASKPGAVAFEDLGIDMVLVDEAHEFKKPPIATKMKMKGLQTQTSDRSIAMNFITRYIRAHNNGNNVHLFTGTPITNTMTEVFHMMRYMMLEEMEANTLADWDAWFGSFAREIEDVELSSTGEYEPVVRLQAFINVPELRRMIGQYMDVVFSDDMPEMQPRQVNGKTMADLKTLTEAERAHLLNGRTEGAMDRPYKQVINDSAEMSPQQMRVFDRVQMLAWEWRQMSKGDRKKAMAAGDPTVPIIHDGIAEKASFDVRLVRAIENAGKEGSPEMKPHPDSKPARVVAKLLELYRSSPKATQAVFMQQGIAKSVTRSEGPVGEKTSRTYPAFSTLHDMIARLVDAGVPRDQIAMVTGSTTGEKKKEIAAAMNRGDIRIVFGSTQSLGVGVNMQKNLRALHHMDAPWMPGELEQRNGRGQRQGNQWNTVQEYRYLTDRLDGRRWQVLAIKQKFITDFMKSKGNLRVIEGDAASDEQSDILSTFSDAAGDPRILLKAKHAKKIEALESRKRLHAEAQSDAIRKARRIRAELPEIEQQLKDAQDSGVVDIATKLLDQQRGDTFRATILGRNFENGAEAADFVAKELAKEMRIEEDRAIGTYGGHKLHAQWHKHHEAPDLYMMIGNRHITSNGPSLRSLQASLRWLRDDMVPRLEGRIADMQKDIRTMEAVAAEPFFFQEQLDAAKKLHGDIERDLAINPVAPPYWLRSGAPVDTPAFWDGKEFLVTGHRWSNDGYFVLGQDDRGAVAIPYIEATDAQGMPLYQEHDFEAPKIVEKKDEAKPAPKVQDAPEDAGFSETPPSLRRYGFPDGRFPAISAFHNDSVIKAHPDYRAAKAGDPPAAARLILATVDAGFVERVRAAFGPDVIFVAPHAEEASGRNAIPMGLSSYLAESVGAALDAGIVQTSRAYHTGARPIDRLLGRATFGGPVKPGKSYVLVDDVTVLGGTLAELANHIRSSGGAVAGAVTLVSTSRGGVKPAARQHVRLIEERYPETVRAEFGIEPSALTADEAVAILGFRDADALRGGIAKAKQERSGRLLQKGIQPSEAEGEVAPDDGFAESGRRFAKAKPVTEKRVITELKGRLTDLQPGVLAAIPFNYFNELARPGMTAVGDYLRVKRIMDAYRGKKHSAMDEVAQEWLKFARLGKDKTKALADLMHDATIAGVDPAKPRLPEADPATYNALKARYNALPPTGKVLYNKVRDAYSDQADELDKILLDNVRKAQEIALKHTAAAFDKELARIDASKRTPAEKKRAREEAQQKYNIDKTRAAWSMKARLTKMRIAFEASRVQPPYFPLARFGRYFVAVRDVDGQLISFSKRERAADRDRLAADMRKAYPGADVEVGVMEDSSQLKQAMDPRIVAEIETILGSAAVDSAVMDQIWQRYLESMPDLSTRKRFIHRKGLPGFEGDALRAFASHMFHAAHQMARLKYGLELQELTNDVVDQARDSDDPTKGMTLANEIKKRHQWVMNPVGGKTAQVMTSAAFVYFLAASPAAALVNMTQTPMLGIPILAGRFGGFAKAASAMLKASKDSVVGRGSVGRAKLSRDERGALDAFYDSGLIDRTQAHDIAGVGETGVEYTPLRARVMKVMSFLFHRAEVWNREVTALAAYRMARSAGQDHAKAVDTAHDLTWKTHFDYANSSRPRLMQNDLAKVALVFRAHNINLLYRLFRDIRQSFKGDTPQARREARYQLAGILGMQTLLAGVTGVAGFHVMMALAGMVLGDDDDPFDFEDNFRKAVLDTLGPELGGVVLNGAPGHYAGIDITARIGMPDLWFRSPPRDLEGRDEYEYWVMNSLGASIGMVGEWWHGANLIMDGDVARGVEAVAPKWAKDMMKAGRYAQEGVQGLRGDQVVEREQLSPWNIIGQAMGFTPAKVAEAYDRKAALLDAESRIYRKRADLMNEFAAAQAMEDDEALNDVLDKIDAFNAKDIYAATPITAEGLISSVRSREKNALLREDGALIENRALGEMLRERLPERVY